jgi:hypothetical protein
MATLKTKRRKNTTETINTGIETQVKDRITVNREITVSTAMKVITLNETMESLTVIKVEATQEADPVTITTKGQVKDRITVNREITVSTAMKVITLNETMESLTVIKVVCNSRGRSSDNYHQG